MPPPPPPFACRTDNGGRGGAQHLRGSILRARFSRQRPDFDLPRVQCLVIAKVAISKDFETFDLSVGVEKVTSLSTFNFADKDMFDTDFMGVFTQVLGRY